MKAVACACAVLMAYPAHAQKPELVVQVGHPSGADEVAFSPNGRCLASANRDGTITLWDATTGQEIRTIVTGTHFFGSIAFSPDGRWLASLSGHDNDIELWEVTTGHGVRTLTGHAASVTSLAFSPNGRWLASGSEDGAVKLWDPATGTEVRHLAGHKGKISSIDFSSDSRWLASGGDDHTVRLWDVATGQPLRTLERHAHWVTSVAFSPSGQQLASAAYKTIKLWDPTTGQELRTWEGHSDLVASLAFSPDGRWLASGSRDKTIKLWDPVTGLEERALEGNQGETSSLAFSPNGRWLASAGWGNVIKLWDVTTWRELRVFKGYASFNSTITLSRNGRWLASGSTDGAINVWDLATGREVRHLAGHKSRISSMAFSADSRWLASGGDDHTVRLWDVATGQPLRTLEGDAHSIALSPDGQQLAAATYDAIKLWNTTTGKEIRTLQGGGGDFLPGSVAFVSNGGPVALERKDGKAKLWDLAAGQELWTWEGVVESVLAFSPDGRTLAFGSDRNTLKLLDVPTGHELRSIKARTFTLDSLAFSAGGHQLASGDMNGIVKLWDVGTGQELRTLEGHTDCVLSLAFSPNGSRLLSTSNDLSIRMWAIPEGTEIARAYSLAPTDWAVIDPQGRFDASPDAMQLMHWVVGLEPIAFDQLKHRYWDPGLLAKIFGFNKEPLSDVSAFDKFALYPEVEPGGTVDADGKLRVKLRNRGGGIGSVQILVNDMELVADARGPNFDPNASEAALTVDVSGAALLPGQENDIRVVPRNAEGVPSRGVTITWKPPGAAEDHKPELYAIVSGISEYAGDVRRLTFSAKDAEDMARALQLGGNRLFGADHVHLTVLSSYSKPGEFSPLKANFKQAFKDAQKAKPGDVLVVYFSGHGITVNETYAYPTSNATTIDEKILSVDSKLLAQTTITSNELVEWILKIQALHKVMILDTCRSGTAAGIVEAKGGGPGDQIRALEDLKDRTGFHILMGSAPNSDSYEASRYNSGLLTYALLQGMRGAALKNDVEVDVRTLFQYAVDKVPDFLAGLRLEDGSKPIQKPEIFARPEAASFDIGRLTPEDKQKIPQAVVRPPVLRPVLINPEEGTDSLDLMTTVRAHLRDQTYAALHNEDDAASRGEHTAASCVFVDADEMPGAMRPSGTYTIEGKRVTVKLTLTRDDKKLRLEVQGLADDPSALGAKIVAAILEACKTF